MITLTGWPVRFAMISSHGNSYLVLKVVGSVILSW
jgi:hypothetical protein